MPDPRSRSASRLLRCLAVLGCSAMTFAGVSCGGGGGSGGGGGGGGNAVDLASVTPTPVAAAKNSGAGSFAADYLRSTHFDELWVEVDYPTSRPPSTSSLDLLRDRLLERCNKPGGVSIIVDDAIPDAEFPASVKESDLRAIEDAHRDFYANLGARVVVMYVLYVTGSSNLSGPSGEVLGLSYRGSSFALFVDAAEQGANPAITTAEVEGAGDVHEAGHLLGLVDGGVPMASGHEDGFHPFHCNVNGCIEYWIVSVPVALPNIGDPTFAQWDPLCVADLQAFGGKGAVPGVLAGRVADDAGDGERVGVGACGTCERRRVEAERRERVARRVRDLRPQR